MGLGPTEAQRGDVVLFLDDDGWASFDQTAAALRRRGLRPVRVITERPARLRRLLREPHLRWAADRLFYHEVISLDLPEGLARLEALIGGGRAADAILAEPTLMRLGLDSTAGRLLLGVSRGFRATRASLLLDKFHVNAALVAAGVPAPRQIAAESCTPAEAMDRLGLPLVLKNPTGASGVQVRVARTAAELAAGLDELARDGQSTFYQEYSRGPVVMYVAVLGPGGRPLIEHGLKVERAQSELGPSAEVSLYDRPELLTLGRRAAALFAPEGFAAFGFVEAPDGRLLHIDANIRIWGNIASTLKLGIDFVDAYAALLRGEPWTRPAAAPQSAPLKVYPYALFAAAQSGGPREVGSTLADFLGVCRSSLGLGYCAHAVGQTALLGRRRMFRRRAGRPERPLAKTVLASDL